MYSSKILHSSSNLPATGMVVTFQDPILILFEDMQQRI